MQQVPQLAPPLQAPQLTPAPQSSASQQGQIYLLTGFFGAGKTSTIRSILSNPKGQRYAVIQNQFAQGQMGIQQPLIMDESGTPFSSFLQLPNGCICCSAKTDLIAAIQYIIANTPVKHILVETNGIADPLQSIKQFWFDQEALIRAQLHSVVAVVNGKKWKDNQEKNIFWRQIASANVVVVGFVDQMTEEEYQNVREGIRQINFECSIVRNDLKDMTQIFKGKSLFNKQSLTSLTTNSTPVQHHQGKLHPIFLRGHCTLSSSTELEQQLGQLLWQSQVKIMRMKGVVCFDQEEEVYQVQGVQELFQVKKTKTKKEVYKGESRVLCIGEGLDKGKIGKILRIEENKEEEEGKGKEEDRAKQEK